MNNVRRLKRPFIWIKRFRHRCGYGVHSPFAFEFITNVIYEKAPYYAYKELEQQKRRSHIRINRFSLLRKKNRLLFRLVNRIQPVTIWDVGSISSVSSYLQAAKRSADYIAVADSSSLPVYADVVVDFVYIHEPENIEFVKAAWQHCIRRVSQHSVIVLEGIHYTDDMRAFWEQCVSDERVGITFDLYDLGIMLFDKSKIKQHYIVNF